MIGMLQGLEHSVKSPCSLSPLIMGIRHSLNSSLSGYCFLVRELGRVFEAYYSWNGPSPPFGHLAIWLDTPEILLSAGNCILQWGKGAGPLIGIIDLAPKVVLVSQELSKRSDRSRDLPMSKQETE
jgi:hypothetical protein